ncbi:conjugal transfer protein TrbL [Fusobacterium necrogenes]|uniref:Conjugal transfer protein TrbL n=1 Tax=Fusobacterium necrogenes TaxID=858 RepID=A0A377GQG9_9FUSO|nr:P-type conjugative transfer protein TrbL [Fusobacterium necrogenes]STO28731.1 conjugal transfer protein TrbL [Fusobacterium necrogenes]
MNTLTEVLSIFLKAIINIPDNLKNISLGLLCVFTIIDITLEVFNLEETDWNKYIIKKVFRVGILIYLITNWSWLLKEVMLGFLKIGKAAINISVGNKDFIDNPSDIIDLGIDLGFKILDQGSWSAPLTYLVLGIIFLLIIIGFFFLAFSVIITSIEYYFLTGIAIIFLPFGTLKVGENYYTNVFKLVVGCGIKMCILNLIMLISQPIIDNLTMNLGNKTNNFLHAAAVIIILAYIALQIPSMAASLMTGSPALNASAALQTGLAGLRTAVAGVGAAATTIAAGAGAYAGAMGGANSMADKGGMAGSKLGGAIGGIFGPGGVAVGQAIGGAFGTAVGGVAGMASGAAQGAYSSLNKNKGETKTDNKKEDNNANNKATNANNKTTPSNTNGNTDSGSVNTDTGTTPSNTNGNTDSGSVNTDTGTTPSNTNSNTDNGSANTNTGSKLKREDMYSNINHKTKLNGEEI